MPGAVLLYPGDPGAPKVDFQLDFSVRKLIPQYYRLGITGPVTVCATVVGEFVSKRLFHRGYGPAGVLKFGFVLKSILDIKYCR
jgi:hypothetical protein